MNVKSMICTVALFVAVPLNAPAATLNSWLSDVKLSVVTDESGHEILTAETKLTSNFGLLPVTLPIPNPKKPEEIIGQVSLVTDFFGTSYSLVVQLDVSQALTVKKAGFGTLPNKSMIPLAGVNMMNWIALPIKGGKGQVYLNLDVRNKAAVVGAALNVDALASKFPMNLLLPFNYNNIGGLAGLYLGPKSQAGFAAFIDAGSLLRK